MSIYELTDETIEQRCDVCGHTQSVHLAELTIGMSQNDQVNAAILPIHPCKNCGAQEYLFPTPKDAPPHPSQGTFGHKHAMLVNVLYERLLEIGRVDANVNPDDLEIKKCQAEEIDRWFNGHLRIENPHNPTQK